MASSELMDQYFTYEGRLASFQKNKKRGSAANRGPKQPTWPHKSITPASLASAGFFFSPSPDNPDNTVCFLCGNGLDGWESGDDPLAEHLKHAPDCGWAITAAIEVELGDYFQQDPSLPEMMEARKATFAGRWPHEAKKGWKCKTKQLVDAGWKYTPTYESEDMATCTYCQLALDGWERNDKPLDEHYKRSPGCSFFAMINQSQTTKKGSRAKTARASKASRLSVQSVATVASEATSVNEMTVGPEDSVLTTASTMTQGAKKTKAKKPAASRAKKGKAKKAEAAEVVEKEEQVEEQPAPPPKPTRGKKRTSDVAETSVISSAEAPAPKRRATRPRGLATETSVVGQEDIEAIDGPSAKVVPEDHTQSTHLTESSRPTSAASAVSAVSDGTAASAHSFHGPPGTFPDDDEIERQLQADLDRQLSDGEDEHFVVHDDSMQSKGNEALRKSADYHMFDPSPAEPDEADVDDELMALQAEMEVDEPEVLEAPKKDRKSAGRKATKQTKSNVANASTVSLKAENSMAETSQHSVEHVESDDGQGSHDATVKENSKPRVSAGKRGRGRPSKASLASQAADELAEPVEAAKPAEPVVAPAKRGRGRPSKASLASRASSEFAEAKPNEAPVKRGRGRPPKHSLEARASMGPAADERVPASKKQDAKESEEDVLGDEPEPRIVLEAVKSPAVKGKVSASSPPPPLSSSQNLAQPPLTPAKIISPAPSARQPALSPSQSPQSSDAENQPPSSKPAASATAKRVVLAPVATTPVRDSPSRRNILAGLQSSTAWTAADLDAVLGSPRGANKENGTERFLKQGKELTSPEKRMTVEEWIYHNAAQAEKQLKHECEMMISRFESEGTRAMNVLEGLKTE